MKRPQLSPEQEAEKTIEEKVEGYQAEEAIEEKIKEYQTEGTVEKRIKKFQAEEKGARQKRQDIAMAFGPQKADAEQIEKLRRVINAEEERSAKVKAWGPQKATKKQKETFKPVNVK